jgi:hypothetical protein
MHRGGGEVCQIVFHKHAENQAKQHKNGENSTKNAIITAIFPLFTGKKAAFLH